MAPPRVHIIGAGIASLVLSRALLHRGIIPTLVCDKSRDRHAHPRNRHAITLFPSSYGPLLPILGLDDAGFRQRVAVDAGMPGCGASSSPSSPPSSSEEESGFRAHRGRFENLLAEHLAIRWEKGVEGLGFGDDGADAELRFMDGDVVRLNEKGNDGGRRVVVVGADGPHSVLRAAVAPASELKVLPFAVYHGRRKFTTKVFRERFAAEFESKGELVARHGEVRLAVGIDECSPDEVSLGYTYSRPGRGEGEDGLFRPRRGKEEATVVPERLFEEVGELRGKLKGIFEEVFRVDQMREDRILNWLMRTSEVEVERLTRAAKDGVVLMGDAVHAEAILGGRGANRAIEDGVVLADVIASGQGEGLEAFYDARYEAWTRSSRQSTSRINGMHGTDRSNL